jgi:hypothetical protein
LERARQKLAAVKPVVDLPIPLRSDGTMNDRIAKFTLAMKAAGETGGAFTLVENIYGCVLGLMQEVLQPTLRDTSNPVSTQIAAPPPRSSAGTRAESAQVPNSSSRLSAMITPITVAANTRLDTRTTSPEWLIQVSIFSCRPSMFNYMNSILSRAPSTSETTIPASWRGRRPNS